MYAYNLFRSTRPDGLSAPSRRNVCSAFRRWPHWRFDGRFETQRPTGFRPESRHEGVRFNGFYLFASFQKDRSDR